MEKLFRLIPKIDALIERPEFARIVEKYGRPQAVSVARLVAKELKTAIRDGSVAAESFDNLLTSRCARACRDAEIRPLIPVINATGVPLHTNLGRAALGPEIAREAAEIVAGYSPVEIDLADGRRGVRGEFVRQTLARLSGAADALVVNNNAAAVLLILSEFARGREVIVSRGECVQIGGGFRVHEVLAQSGAILNEVGSTNITEMRDYEEAIGPDAAAILKVHLSNFSLSGFVKRPEIAELAKLKSDDILLVEDLGSGSLIDRIGDFVSPDPTPARSIADGADLVSFSGDKLLGGPQAGIIVGRADLITRLSKNPLFRAIRPDKFTYAALQSVLTRYETGRAGELAPWRYILKSREQIKGAIESFIDKYDFAGAVYGIVETEGEFGAGSLPGVAIPSAALSIKTQNPDRAAQFCRRADPPVIGIVRDRLFLIDFLCIEDDQLPALAAVIKQLAD